MRFLMTYKQATPAPPSDAERAELAKFADNMMKSGVVIDTGGLLPISQGARVQLAGGKASCGR